MFGLESDSFTYSTHLAFDFKVAALLCHFASRRLPLSNGFAFASSLASRSTARYLLVVFTLACPSLLPSQEG
jgi:hypothetical protein